MKSKKSTDIKNWSYLLSYKEITQLKDWNSLLSEAVRTGTCIYCHRWTKLWRIDDKTGLCGECSFNEGF